MIMCVLLCYPVSIHMSQLLSTGCPISSFEEKMKELNREFSNIYISPRHQTVSLGKTPFQVVTEFEQQAIQNLCTINFSTCLLSSHR